MISLRGEVMECMPGVQRKVRVCDAVTCSVLRAIHVLCLIVPRLLCR